MNCEKFSQMLDNYEALTEKEKLQLAEHTTQCEKCKKEYDFFMSVIKSVRNLPALSAPDDFVSQVRARIDSAPRRREKIIVMLRKNWYKYSSVAACLLIAAVIGMNSDMLVSKMNPADDGVVISETKNRSDRDKAPADQVSPEKSIAPENNSESGGETSKTEAQDRKDNSTTAPAQSVRPRMTAIPSDAYNNVLTPEVSVSRNTTPVSPSANRTAVTSRPSYTQAPVSAPQNVSENNGGGSAAVQTEAPAASSEITVAEATVPETGGGSDSTEAYALERNRYRIPSAYSDSGSQTEKNNDDGMSGYSISSSGGEFALSAAGDPEDPADSVRISGSIYVDIQYADEFMSIMNSYITGSGDNYYLINSSSLPVMFSELSAQGVNYGDFIGSSASGEIAFNVVFF